MKLEEYKKIFEETIEKYASTTAKKIKLIPLFVKYTHSFGFFGAGLDAYKYSYNTKKEKFETDIINHLKNHSLTKEQEKELKENYWID